MVKMYECIIDDGENVFKETVPAKNKKELLSVYGGNGTFEKIKDVTKDYFGDDIENAVDILRRTLQVGGYGYPENLLICYLLEEHLRNRK